MKKYKMYSTNKYFVNRIQYYIKTIIYYDQVGLIPRVQGRFIIWKSINIIYYINMSQEK